MIDLLITSITATLRSAFVAVQEPGLAGRFGRSGLTMAMPCNTQRLRVSLRVLICGQAFKALKAAFFHSQPGHGLRLPACRVPGPE